MKQGIDTFSALQGIIGKAPSAIDLKVIDHLDENALRWLGVSPLMFAGFGDGAALAVTLGGGKPGFAGGNPRGLRLPLAALDDPALARPGAGFGSLFLAPGIGETLRVNGRVAAIEGGEAVVAVEECYVHCAKALIRSGFWSAAPLAEAPDDPAAFVAASCFMALATADARGHADLSPKGDPAGSMARLEDDALWFADRPGNRRVDSFRNILDQPHVAAVLIVPGSSRVAILGGTARLTTDEEARARFAVRGKVPHLAVRIDPLALDLRVSPALERARLWPLEATAQGIDPAKIFVAHVKANRERGVGARLTGAVMSIPGLMRKGLDKDYKDNLY